MRKNREHIEQSALMSWVNNFGVKQYPELELLHAIPNGSVRHIGTAVKLKKEGVKSGVPDLCLPVSRDGYYGFYIEMKIKPNRPTPNQKWWHEKLREQNYYVFVCYDWPTAKTVLEKYLKNKIMKIKV